MAGGDVNTIIDQKAIQGLINARKEVVALHEETKKYVQELMKVNEELKKGSITFEQLNTAQKKVETSNEKLAGIAKKTLTAEEAINKQKKEGINLLAKSTAAEKELARQKKASIKLTEKENLQLAREEAAIKKVIKSDQDLINKVKALRSVRGRLNKTTVEGKKAYDRLTVSIIKNQKAVNKNRLSTGGLAKSLKGLGGQLLGALGVTAGITALVSVLRGAFRKLAAFSQANATLAATLGKTREEIEDLTESAIAFGKTTKFTAVEVSKLQNELAKLGFTTGEIKIQTDAVLKLAEATGADLADAAKVTGIALKAYGLSAIEATRVASVLAISTTKSALSFADFETALSTVGPVAKAFGFSLEDTIALMGKLRDAGFDSSKSSTALRNILLNLADSNGALAKKLGGSVTSLEEFIPAMVKLRASGVDLNETLQLTDKRSVAAFNTLLEGADDVLVLRDAITDVNAALDEMVGVKTDNTIDAMARMGSAWDGVVLSFRNSEGFFVGLFDGLSGFLNVFTDKYTDSFDKIFNLGTLGLAQGAKNAIKERQKVFDSLEDLNEKELIQLANSLREKSALGDEFSKDVIKQTVERIIALREADELAKKREKQAVIDAKAVIKEANEESAAEKLALDKLTASLFFTDQEKQSAALDRKVEKLRAKGVAEVDITRFIIQERQKLLDEEIDKELKAFDKLLKEKQRLADEALKEEFDLEEEESVPDIADDPEVKAATKRAIEILKIGQDLVNKRTDIEEISLKEVEDLYAADVLSFEEAEALKTDIAQKAADQKQEIIDAAINLGIAAIDTGFQIYQDNIERESIALQTQLDTDLAALTEERAAELALAKGNKEEEERINLEFDEREKIIKEEFAKKEAVLKTKAFKADKAAKVVQAIINTALAVTSAATAPPPAGFILAGIAAALGALQIATIVSQPIPQFYKGTESVPTDGVISVAEKGGELGETKTGKIFYAPKQTYLTGMKGATIYSSEKTKRILDANPQIFINSGFDSRELKQAYEKSSDKIVRELKRRRGRTIKHEQGGILDRRDGGKVFQRHQNVLLGKQYE